MIEKIGDIDNAIACFNAYLLLKPYDEVVLAHLGKLYFKTEQYDNALIILSKAHDDRSKLLLSKMYRKGLGVDQDKKLARDIRKRVSFFKRESIPIIIVFLVSMIIGFFTPTYIIPGVKILAGRCYKDSENYKSNYGYQYLSSLHQHGLSMP